MTRYGGEQPIDPPTKDRPENTIGSGNANRSENEEEDGRPVLSDPVFDARLDVAGAERVCRAVRPFAEWYRAQFQFWYSLHQPP